MKIHNTCRITVDRRRGRHQPVPTHLLPLSSSLVHLHLVHRHHHSRCRDLALKDANDLTPLPHLIHPVKFSLLSSIPGLIWNRTTKSSGSRGAFTLDGPVQ